MHEASIKVTLDFSYVDDEGFPDGEVCTVTLFESLIAHGELALIEKCLENGADINSQRECWGYFVRYSEESEGSCKKAPLQWAKNDSVRDFLVQHGARLGAEDLVE